MTNNFPSFEGDQQPQGSAERYINFTDSEGWKEFIEVAERINFALADFDVHAPGSEELLDAYDECVAEYFGVDYDDQKATVFGIADVVDIDDTLRDKPQLLYGEEKLVFGGVIIYPINNIWRVRLAFHSLPSDTIDPSITFYVQADKYSITELKILEKTEQEMNGNRYSDAVTKLVENARTSADFTASDTFLSLKTQDQHEQLYQQAELVGNEFLPYYKETEVDIECTKFYTIPDDMSNLDFPIEMFVSDQTQFEEKERFIPSGTVIGCSYLEQLDDPNQHFTKPADLNLGFGSPCIVMYNHGRQCHYYIVPQTISDVTITKYVENEE